MKLSPHFTLDELTASNTAKQRGIDNTPKFEALSNLKRLADVLEKIRKVVGRPIIVTSGYRGPVLNKAVGGVSSSDHQSGEAADIAVTGMTPYQLASVINEHADTIQFGQLIQEVPPGRGGWVHVSIRPGKTEINKVLTYDGKSYQPGLRP